MNNEATRQNLKRISKELDGTEFLIEGNSLHQVKTFEVKYALADRLTIGRITIKTREGALLVINAGNVGDFATMSKVRLQTHPCIADASFI